MNVRFRHRNKTYGHRYHEFIGHNLDCDICVVEELACCSNHSVNALDEIIYNINSAIADMGKELLYHELYGYKIKECKNLDKYIQLKTQRDSIKKHMVASIKNATTCLKCKELEIIIENVKKILGHSCYVFVRGDIEIDSTNKTQWDTDNPYCVSREKWEELAYKVCDSLGIDISITSLDELCDIAFNTIITPQLCNIIDRFKIEKQNCDPNYELIINEQQCELDYNLLIHSTSCTLDFELYKELLHCNLDATFIQEIYSCDMELKLTKEKQNCAILVTTTGTEIDLCSLNFNIETELNNSNC